MKIQGYKIYLIAKTGSAFDITEAVTKLTWSDRDKELARQADVTIQNAILPDGVSMEGRILQKNAIIPIYTEDGKLILKGVVWDTTQDFSPERTVTVKLFDRSVFATRSTDHFYFEKGMRTESILRAICDAWGIKLRFDYVSIEHGIVKKSRVRISDAITSILDEVWLQTGERYALFFSDADDALHVRKWGTNEEILQFYGKGPDASNIESIQRKSSKDRMVTKVIITGAEPKEGRAPVVATETGDTDWGTIQDIVTHSKDDDISKARTEARNILKEKGIDRKTTVVAPDDPTIRKGDRVRLDTSVYSGDMFVISASHDANRGTMNLELEER